ncbi:MAG: hypothetical protein AAFO15_00785 [Pseudomonadota bacterium]
MSRSNSLERGVDEQVFAEFSGYLLHINNASNHFTKVYSLLGMIQECFFETPEEICRFIFERKEGKIVSIIHTVYKDDFIFLRQEFDHIDDNIYILNTQKIINSDLLKQSNRKTIEKDTYKLILNTNNNHTDVFGIDLKIGDDDAADSKYKFECTDELVDDIYSRKQKSEITFDNSSRKSNNIEDRNSKEEDNEKTSHIDEEVNSNINRQSKSESNLQEEIVADDQSDKKNNSGSDEFKASEEEYMIKITKIDDSGEEVDPIDQKAEFIEENKTNPSDELKDFKFIFQKDLSEETGQVRKAKDDDVNSTQYKRLNTEIDELQMDSVYLSSQPIDNKFSIQFSLIEKISKAVKAKMSSAFLKMREFAKKKAAIKIQAFVKDCKVRKNLKEEEAKAEKVLKDFAVGKQDNSDANINNNTSMQEQDNHNQSQSHEMEESGNDSIDTIGSNDIQEGIKRQKMKQTKRDSIKLSDTDSNLKNSSIFTDDNQSKTSLSEEMIAGAEAVFDSSKANNLKSILKKNGKYNNNNVNGAQKLVPFDGYMDLEESIDRASQRKKQAQP